MIGKIIGAALGARAAKETTKLDGPMGAAIGFIAPAILRRLSIPGMILLGAGGYAIKKLSERSQLDHSGPVTTKKTPRAVAANDSAKIEAPAAAI